jgi:redox-sensitive bicupin YhaK (pirin superfamily)
MIELVLDQRRRNLGGFDVGRVLPQPSRRMIGPFVFFDHMGPVDFSPGISRDVDVRPHPHIGLSTLTYLFDGEIMHRDSVGSEQAIVPGEVNWMTAGKGITHSERFERARRVGGRMDDIQAWVALPKEDEETDPIFAHYGQEALPEFGSDGARGHLIAGGAFGASAPVPVHSPLFFLHWELQPGSVCELPDEYPERAAFVSSGSVDIEGRLYPAGRMVVFDHGPAPLIRAVEPSTIIALGGDTVGPRFIEWNFVSSSKERIEQAKADWRAGRMKLPDLDDSEWIPLPGESAPPNPMS